MLVEGQNAHLFYAAAFHLDYSVAQRGNSIELEFGIEKFFRVRVQCDHRGHQTLCACGRNNAAEQLGMARVNAVEISNGERSALAELMRLGASNDFHTEWVGSLEVAK